jgi:hypothetical protein
VLEGEMETPMAELASTDTVVELVPLRRPFLTVSVYVVVAVGWTVTATPLGTGPIPGLMLPVPAVNDGRSCALPPAAIDFGLAVNEMPVNDPDADEDRWSVWLCALGVLGRLHAMTLSVKNIAANNLCRSIASSLPRHMGEEVCNRPWAGEAGR